VYPFSSLHLDYCNTYISQAVAAKGVRASEDRLINAFERVEIFVRRLETYTKVPPTVDMMEIAMKIMVELLCVLAIATKEIEQGRMSEQFLINMSWFD